MNQLKQWPFRCFKCFIVMHSVRKPWTILTLLHMCIVFQCCLWYVIVWMHNTFCCFSSQLYSSSFSLIQKHIATAIIFALFWSWESKAISTLKTPDYYSVHNICHGHTMAKVALIKRLVKCNFSHYLLLILSTDGRTKLFHFLEGAKKKINANTNNILTHSSCIKSPFFPLFCSHFSSIDTFFIGTPW